MNAPAQPLMKRLADAWRYGGVHTFGGQHAEATSSAIIGGVPRRCPMSGSRTAAVTRNADVLPPKLVTSLRLYNRLVAKKDNPTLKCSCPCKFQVQLVLDVFEYWRVIAQGNGIHHDLIFIDQTLFCKLG